MTRWRTRHRGDHDDRGAAAVEFAIVLVVLLLILLGIIDFGRLLFVQQAVKSASREGARTAVIAPNDGDAVWNAVTNSGSAASLSGGTLSATLTPEVSGTVQPLPGAPLAHAAMCPGSGDAVEVRVTTGFVWLTPVGSLAGGFFTPETVAASTTMRCEG